MRIWTMLATWLRTVIECCSFRRKFPRPPAHILTYDQIAQYWERMNPRWQRECTIIVLRIRRTSSGAPHIWKLDDMPHLAAIRSFFEVHFDPTDEQDPFTIRIDRTYQLQPGMRKHEEICIANFEL